MNEVGGTGTVRPPLLPVETSKVQHPVQTLRYFAELRMIFHGQHEVHQAGPAVFHLLRRHCRIRRRGHPGRKWTRFLRLPRSGAGMGKEAGQKHEQTDNRNWVCPSDRSSSFHQNGSPCNLLQWRMRVSQPFPAVSRTSNCAHGKRVVAGRNRPYHPVKGQGRSRSGFFGCTQKIPNIS